jgi:hypothetical protein
MCSRRGIYLGVSKIHSSTVHLILNPETGVISPQYHCIFDDSFSRVWFDGNFDTNLWNNLVSQVESVDRHFSLEPNRDGTTTLPPDFTPFAPDIISSETHHQDQPQAQLRNTILNNNNNDDLPTVMPDNNPTLLGTTQVPLSSPLLSQ